MTGVQTCALPISGKTLIEINPRKKFGMNILTVKKGTQVIASLDADFVFEPEDQLVVFGNTEKILSFTNKFSLKKKKRK